MWITETATYSVISPEGCASILWKDAQKVAEASACLKLTANDLFALHAVERVLEEKGFSDEFFANLKESVAEFFESKRNIPPEQLVQQRYERFRKF